MPIHSVLSSASSMRLGPPGAPSLIPTGADADNVLDAVPARLTTVRLPVNNPSGCSCWPATYIVDVDTSALLAPPGTARVHELTFGVAEQSAWRAVLVGRLPECCPDKKIIGA